MKPLTNSHIHTNYSFSVFESPAQAVNQAVEENIKILGINDHYTVSGHEEFQKACADKKVCPMFSMEAVAVDQKCLEEGKRFNDPNNPGRFYFTAKSITKKLDENGPGFNAMQTMRKSLTERNEKLIENLNDHLKNIGEDFSISMEAVEALTPAGNTTERHVVQILAEKILEEGKERAGEIAEKLCGAAAPSLDDPATFQNFLRGKLIKAGCPDYAPELPEAFLSIEDMCSLYLEMGAVPLYPVLGNPETEMEENFDDLIDYLATKKIFAIEVIPDRNTRERLLDVVEAAKKAGIPIVTGTEHNTKTPGLLVDKFTAEEPFRTAFFDSALVLLGHRVAVLNGETGYVDSEGNLRFENRAEGLEYFKELGKKFYEESI